MKTTTMLIGKAPRSYGTLHLSGLVVSPYFQPTDTRRVGETSLGRDIKLIPSTMVIKALVAGYVASAGLKVQVFIESDDNTVNASTTIAVPRTYTDTDLDIQASVAQQINDFCTNNSIPTPSIIDWLVVTPTTLAASTAAIVPASYQTIISQTGTSAPAVAGGLTPLNTYAAGTTFTWARSSAGVYTITASSAVFSTTGKTSVRIGLLNNLNGAATAVITSSTVITITTAVQSLAVLGLLGFTATPTDALLTKASIEVLTYS